MNLPPIPRISLHPRIYITLSVLLCGSVSLVALVLRGPEIVYPDERDYVELAHSLLSEGAFLNKSGSPTAYRPPGYPALLSLFLAVSLNPWWLKLNGVLAIMVAAWVMGVWTEKLSPGYGWLAPAVLAFYPLAVYTTTTLYPQLWAGAVFLAITYILFRKPVPTLWATCTSGLLYGFLVLMVPSYLLVLIACIGPAFCFLYASSSFKTRIVHVLIFGCMAGAVVVPWTIRNFLHFDAFIPVSTNSGISLLAGNSPGATGSSGVNAYLIERIEFHGGLSEVEHANALTQEALDWIKENPNDAFVLYIKKVLNYFNFRNDLYIQEEASGTKWLAIALTYYPLFLLALLRFSFSRINRPSPVEWFLLLVYLGNSLLSAVFFTRLRFRVPFDFILIVLASISIAILLAHYHVSSRTPAKSR